ncbi:carbohydrate-binding protein [Microvirga sp. STR05]|uniref:Carbohydrate-binding protein n=1 Tax=Hymenobacter duratus TaxID=2771356 RepID=A0ABR8JK67_9BACT|nr:carbohydrate-binding protein [Hymenobacter duratus]MBD2715199.1 carbohydrate-binding protein [Hymenobacter duratus]MBR7950106.1 carbohydrate-binding protein [Microvirga sp. STR05]
MNKPLLFLLLALLLAGPGSRAQTPGATFGLFGYAGATTGTTGGAGGTSVTVNTGAALQTAINGKGAQPLTIYINGTITPANSPGLDKIEVKNKNDISIIGFATLGEFNGIGIKVFRANNIILQNLKVHHVLASFGDGDCISIEGPASHVWVDHCELYNVYQGAGVDDYDGLLDAKSDCEYLTFSWNYLHDAWKASLMGFTDTDNFDRKITYHHNRFENINSRLPLFRFGSGHVFNNYYKDIASTSINSRMGACVKIENNYFDNARNPYVTAYSAQDGFGDVSGNVLVNSPFVYASDVRVLPVCTATIPYTYASVLNPAADVPALVLANAGIGIVGPTLAPGTFQVSTAVVGQGSVSPASGVYNQGQLLTLTATPASGWQFAGWSGDTMATTNPLTFPVRRSRALTATFTQSTTPGAPGSLVRIEDSALPTTGLCSFDGVVSTNSGADNGSVINLTNSSGRGITWKVEVAPAGLYQLKWRYVNSSASSAFTAKLSINGTEVNPAVPFPRTSNSTTFALATLDVTLGPGVNEIRLETTQTASFADIDWLEVSGTRLVAANCASAVGTITGVLPVKAPRGAAAVVQVYPNPGKSAFTFDVTLRRAGRVQAALYSAAGAKVADLLPGGRLLPAGSHQLRCQNPALPAGMYYYILETGHETCSGKLLVE